MNLSNKQRRQLVILQERMTTVLHVASRLLVFLLIAVLLFFGKRYLENREADKLWRLIYPKGDIEDYEKFLKEYPNSSHFESAKECFLEKKREKTAWDEVLCSDNPYVYKSYIDNNPDGTYLRKAMEKLDSMMWARARVGNASWSYQEYLNVVPKGIHAKEAQDFIDKSYRNTLSSHEAEMCKQIIYAMYKAISDHDETNLMRCTSSNLIFQGKKTTRSSILLFMKKIYAEDVSNLLWQMIDINVSKVTGEDNRIYYRVKYSVDLHLNRYDSGKFTYAYYDCIAHINAEHQVELLNMSCTAVS